MALGGISLLFSPPIGEVGMGRRWWALTLRGDLVKVGAQRALPGGGRLLSVPTVWGVLGVIGPCKEGLE